MDPNVYDNRICLSPFLSPGKYTHRSHVIYDVKHHNALCRPSRYGKSIPSQAQTMQLCGIYQLKSINVIVLPDGSSMFDKILSILFLYTTENSASKKVSKITSTKCNKNHLRYPNQIFLANDE